jgi:hypothetical protein
MITQTEFEKLPKQIQKIRWDYFLATDGYYDEEILKQRNIKKIKRMIEVLEKMKQIDSWGEKQETWLNILKKEAK